MLAYNHYILSYYHPSVILVDTVKHFGVKHHTVAHLGGWTALPTNIRLG